MPSCPFSFARGSAARASRHLDEHLHLVAGRVEQGREALVDDVVRLDLRRYDLVHRIDAALDHADDPGPHRHVIAPGRLEGDVLRRPQSRIDARLLHMQADLGNRAMVADRLAAGVETGLAARALDRGIDAAPGPGKADAAHLRAEMVQPAPAVVVIERHYERLDRHPLPLPDPGHVLADFDYLGRKFVAEDLRQRRTGETVRVHWRDDRAGS